MGTATDELAAQLRQLSGALLALAQRAGAVRDDVDIVRAGV
ncbi:SbtR family transcriptional regulator [Streptomyces albiflavescens]